MARTKTKIKQTVPKCFCTFGRTIVRMDHVAMHGCIEYDPTRSLLSPSCGVCRKKENLTLDGRLTEKQKEMMNEGPGSVPGFMSGLM